MKYFLTITENGFIKISEMSEIKKQNRGGAGLKVCSTSEKTGSVVTVVITENLKSSVLIVTSNGTGINFPLDLIRVMGRTATGVRAIKVKEGEKVISLSIV